MNNASLSYLKKKDILHLLISEGPEEGSVELSPDITAVSRRCAGNSPIHADPKRYIT